MILQILARGQSNVYPKNESRVGVRGTARIGKKRETQCERERDGVKARLPNGAVSGLEFEIHAARPQGPRVKKICCNVCSRIIVTVVRNACNGEDVMVMA